MQTTTTHTHPAPVHFPADLYPAREPRAWGRDPDPVIRHAGDIFEMYHERTRFRLECAWMGTPRGTDYNPAEVARLVLRLDCLDMDMGAFTESLGRWPGGAE